MGKRTEKKVSVGSTMLDSSSNVNFAFSWKQSCMIRSAQTSNNGCLVML